jgi:hypothetical protein
MAALVAVYLEVHQSSTKGIARQTVVRTRVNEKDALGDGSRDSIRGGKYTELWYRAHITKREGVSVAISSSATRERQGLVNVNTAAALRPTARRARNLVVTTIHLARISKHRVSWPAAYILRTISAMAGK